MTFLTKNPFIRKGRALIKSMNRSIYRSRIGSSDYALTPPVLCNSFPKSGTHLLKQILSVLPDSKDFGSFIATQPTISVKKRSLHSLRNKIGKIVPDELVCSHLEYDASLESALKERNVVHYFIYRDLRDVVISEAYYLANMNKWHRLHKSFAQRPDMESRNSLCINGGSQRDGLPYEYQNVGERFRSYSGWILSDQCYGVRFEDLVGAEKEKYVRGILEYYLRRSDSNADIDKLVVKAMQAIQPRKSHTFREGKSGGWREKLTPLQKQEVLRVAGDQLELMGYPVEK